MPMLETFSSVHRAENDRLELTGEHLAGFKHSQRVAYDCVTAIERELREGITERAVAKRMGEWLADHGVREFFHQPFVWFGERTAFTRFVQPFQFFPTGKKLEQGMPVILDVAPIIDGHASDIGYACRLGDNARHERMLRDLEPYRQLILDGVRARKTMTDIYREVDQLIERQGYRNRHQAYPFRVLAHRVNLVPEVARTEFKLFGFGVPAVNFLFGRLAQTVRGVEHQTPFWNDKRPAAYPAGPGLWAVEPHIGFDGIGVKWEELLVVTADGDAYWLDDDLPHVRRFTAVRAAHAAASA
jgi:Xaa-Pro aminopeptidase